MQRQLLCLGGGAGAPAARRVRLLLRQLLAPRPGRPELRALHGSGNAAPAAPRPGVGRGCVCVCVPPALGGAPGVGLGVLGAGLRLSVASPVVSLTPGEAGGAPAMSSVLQRCSASHACVLGLWHATKAKLLSLLTRHTRG